MILGSIAAMALGGFALTTAIAIAVMALTVGVVVVIARLLTHLDDEPPWWPEFERQFAEYVIGCG